MQITIKKDASKKKVQPGKDGELERRRAARRAELSAAPDEPAGPLAEEPVAPATATAVVDAPESGPEVQPVEEETTAPVEPTKPVLEDQIDALSVESVGATRVQDEDPEYEAYKAKQAAKQKKKATKLGNISKKKQPAEVAPVPEKSAEQESADDLDEARLAKPERKAKSPKPSKQKAKPKRKSMGNVAASEVDDLAAVASRVSGDRLSLGFVVTYLVVVLACGAGGFFGSDFFYALLQKLGG